MAKEQTYIFGRHPVEEAIRRAPHAVRHFYFVTGHDQKDLEREARNTGIPFDRCDPDYLPRGFDRDAIHQGVIALIDPTQIVVDYKRFIKDLEVTPRTGLVLLDELTDPHNVGAVIRSAAAFGIAGVLLPEHRQAPVTGTVVRVSAGMTFSLPLVKVVNVNTVLRDLKEHGFWVYGLTGGGDTSIMEEQFTKPSVFVVGNEGRGIREKTEDLCDFRLRIPIEQNCESLNAASSAAVTLYAWRAQHDM